jgi:hypothetical protein
VALAHLISTGMIDRDNDWSEVWVPSAAERRAIFGRAAAHADALFARGP